MASGDIPVLRLNKRRPSKSREYEDEKRKRRLVHQVSDWCSGIAIKMGRRQGGPSRTGPKKEHIWIDT